MLPNPTVRCMGVIALVFWAGAVRAETLEVPSRFATIQDALDAAWPGDEVVVADGTYAGIGNRDLDLWGMPVTVRSASGDPSACIIDCEGEGRGFCFCRGEMADSIVSGFTIRNGYATSDSYGGACGGGVYCVYSSPTISNCKISGNTAGDFYDDDYGFGGGVYCCYFSGPTLIECTINSNAAYGWYYASGGVACDDHSSPALTDCTITANVCYGMFAFGGGVGCGDSSSPTLTGCIIRSNICASWMEYAFGGGIYCSSESDATLIDCMISGNEAASGGGMSFSDSDPTVLNSTIMQNVSTGTPYPDDFYSFGGGGVQCTYGSATFRNCRISGNTAYATYSSYGEGGGICCQYSDPTFMNCVISDNAVIGSDEFTGSGGGLYSYVAFPNLINCTFSGNTASCRGGGMHSVWSTPTLTNCILWGDVPEEITYYRGEPVVTSSDFQGASRGTGNIHLDPAFVAAENGDYRLKAGSPCIDAGQNSVVPGGVQMDYSGYPRFVDDAASEDCPYLPGVCGTPPVVDMGAHEYQVAMGACCMGSSCAMTRQPDCTGSWVGGATCSTGNPCQSGACCVGTSCTLTIEADCSGAWTGGATCGANSPCQTGSCCVGAACMVTTQANCAGTWTRDGTCGPDNPCQTGSCCTGTTCTVMVQANCAGTWTADATCGPDNPCQTGSCCVGAACTVTTRANCAGTWTSGGACSSGDCAGEAAGPFTLTYGTNGSGRLNVDPAGGTYAKGTVVRVEAVAAVGWQFAGWTGDVSGSEDSVSLVMDGPRTVIAHFERTGSGPTAALTTGVCGASVAEASLATLLVFLVGPSMARGAFRRRRGPR